MLISFHKLKRLVIIAAIVIIPFIGINLLNLSLNKDSQPVNRVMENNDSIEQVINQKINNQESEGLGFFAEFRMERERIRSKQLELLREVANNQSNNQKVRDAAAMKLVQVSDMVEKEMQTETLIKSKGYRDCAVIVKTDTATIVLDVHQVSEEQQTEITELTTHATGLQKNQITITTRQNYR